MCRAPATPATPTIRLWAMYLGGTIATALPIMIGMAAAIAYETIVRGDPMIVPDGLLAVATVNLPCLLFIGALSTI